MSIVTEDNVRLPYATDRQDGDAFDCQYAFKARGDCFDLLNILR